MEIAICSTIILLFLSMKEQMNNLDHCVYSFMLTAEMAYELSGVSSREKNEFIKNFINQKYRNDLIDKSVYNVLLKKIKYKDKKFFYLWELFYLQYSRFQKKTQELSSLNDRERLKELFLELDESDYLTVWGIDDEFEAQGEQIAKLEKRGMLSIHKNQEKKIKDDGNFPSEDIVILTTYGTPHQCKQIMAKLQKYGFGCKPESFKNKGIVFIGVESAVNRRA